LVNQEISQDKIMNNVTEQHHTLRRYDKELVKLKHQVEKMGDHVSRQIDLVLDHVDDDQPNMDFDDVFENDVTINGMEVKASKTVIRLLAKQAPVGKDLRFIIAVSRIVTELERIGDEVVTIARSFDEDAQVTTCTEKPVTVSVTSLLASAKNLLDRALLAARHDDVDTATSMINSHLAKEGSYYEDAQQLVACIKEHHESIEGSFNAALQANSLKRICDHICNICEHTVFLVTGEDIRHQEDDLETA
jgi:phosphate transport system protein